MLVKLENEYTISGKTFNELELNLDDLTGNDLIIAEKEFKARNKGATVKELEDGWLVTIAAKSTGLKYGDVLKFKGKDYLRVVNKVRNFLTVGLDSEETTENKEIEVTEIQDIETSTEE